VRIDPLLEGLKDRLYTETYTVGVNVGGLTEEWVSRLGLPAGIAVSAGSFDAHIGALGGGVKQGMLSKIMGTSTCDMLVVPPEVLGTKLIPGICGQVDGSIIPGMLGLEAGQSAYGDVYAWFRKLLSWPLESLLPETSLLDQETVQKLKDEIEDKILAKLGEEASQISVEETGLIALDWLNGRRTPFADQALKGALIGLTLGTSAAKIFKALVEATAFGAKAINEQFNKYGVEIQEVIATGGITHKSDFVMQVNADVLNMPIKVAASEQACALGAAMCAAVAAGVYPSIPEAQENMESGFSKIYRPAPDNAAKYEKLYKSYRKIGEVLEEHLKGL
jgi:L-ribulokinase